MVCLLHTSVLSFLQMYTNVVFIATLREEDAIIISNLQMRKMSYRDELIRLGIK